MLIDPFTVVAQVVNFALLAWALKHFLYGRVLEAMDERERLIAERIGGAERRETEAAVAAAESVRRLEEFERDRAQRLKAAKAEVETYQQELMSAARSNADAKEAQWARALATQRRELEKMIRHRVGELAVDMSRRVLSDLAPVDLDDIVVSAALDRLATEPDSRTALVGDPGAEAPPITVVTAAELSTGRQHDVRVRLRDLIGCESRQICFETDPELILGVEFRSSEVRVPWTVADHLGELDELIGRLMAALPDGGEVDARAR